MKSFTINSVISLYIVYLRMKRSEKTTIIHDSKELKINLTRKLEKVTEDYEENYVEEHLQ